MKKLGLAILLFGILSPFPAASAVKIFACEPEWSALSRAVGGDAVSAWSATTEQQDPHYIRARPSLIARIRSARLVFCSGAGLEVGWLPILMQRGARAGVQPGRPGHLLAFEHVDVLEIPTVIDRSLGDIHPEGNPHLHLDPRNMLTLSRELARRLAIVEPESATSFQAGAKKFAENWQRRIAGWEPRIAKLKGMPVIVHHKSWSYLINWIGLKQVASLEPKPGIPPSADHLRKLIGEAKQGKVKAIIRTPFDPDRPSEWLSGKTGIPAIELPYTVPRGAGEAALTGLFDSILAALEKANAGR